MAIAASLSKKKASPQTCVLPKSMLAAQLEARTLALKNLPQIRRHFWHPTVYAWCSEQVRACVRTVLIVELRIDQIEAHLCSLHERQSLGLKPLQQLYPVTAEFFSASVRASMMTEANALPSLAHDLWLHILEFLQWRDEMEVRQDLYGR